MYATVNQRMLYFPKMRSLLSFWLQRIAILRCIVFRGRSDCVFNEFQLWAGFRQLINSAYHVSLAKLHIISWKLSSVRLTWFLGILKHHFTGFTELVLMFGYRKTIFLRGCHFEVYATNRINVTFKHTQRLRLGQKETCRQMLNL